MVFITIILPCIYQLRPPSIHLIFEKGNGSYTKRALFYQDILLYSKDIKEMQKSSFKDRELTNWLLKYNLELVDYYSKPPYNHTPPSARAENRLDRVKASVRDLINLGLIRETGTAPAEKGGTRPVQVYGYTDDGILLACLIESFDQNKRERAYSEAYDVLQSMLSIEPASYEIFHSSLYKKYKARGVFGEFIMDRLRESLESISEINTLGELRYSSLIIFHTNDAAKGRLYLDLWNETFNEMSPSVQELLLFHMKMEIEQRMMHRAMAPQKYEKYPNEICQQFIMAHNGRIL